MPILVSIAVSLVILALYLWPTNTEHLTNGLGIEVVTENSIRLEFEALYKELKQAMKNKDAQAIKDLKLKKKKLLEKKRQLRALDRNGW